MFANKRSHLPTLHLLEVRPQPRPQGRRKKACVFRAPPALNCGAQVAMDGTLKRSLSLLARGVSSVTSLVVTSLVRYVTDSLSRSIRIAPTSCRIVATLGNPPVCGA